MKHFKAVFGESIVHLIKIVKDDRQLCGLAVFHDTIKEECTSIMST